MLHSCMPSTTSLHSDKFFVDLTSWAGGSVVAPLVLISKPGQRVRSGLYPLPATCLHRLQWCMHVSHSRWQHGMFTSQQHGGRQGRASVQGMPAYMAAQAQGLAQPGARFQHHAAPEVVMASQASGLNLTPCRRCTDCIAAYFAATYCCVCPCNLLVRNHPCPHACRPLASTCT